MIWDWRGNGRRAARAREARRLRRNGLVGSALGIGGSVLLYYARGSTTLAWVIGAAAVASGLAAAASPLVVYRSIQHGLGAVGRGIGAALGWVLLAPLFYLFFWPFGAFLRRGARDVLGRRPDRALPTYWRRRPERPRTLSDYERLF